MSNAVFPVLPGQTWPRLRVFQKRTTIKRAGGRRYALSDQLYPTYLYRINYSYLRAADFDTLASFWRVHGGALDSWLFDDRDDNTVDLQPFGTGDDTTTAFQLVRTVGGFAEPVYAVNGAPVVRVNGVVTGVTVGAAGVVTFASAPAAAAPLTWSGQYHWRCAFTKSEQEFEEFMRRLRTTRAVEFETFHP